MKDDTGAFCPSGAIVTGKKVSLDYFNSRISVALASHRAEPGGRLRRSDEAPEIAEAHFKETFHDSNADKPASAGNEDQLPLFGNPHCIFLSVEIILHINDDTCLRGSSDFSLYSGFDTDS